MRSRLRVALLLSAAVVDKNLTLERFAQDVRGTKRPQGAAWDIGAYEYTEKK